MLFLLSSLAAEQRFLGGRHNRSNQQLACCRYRKLHLDRIEVDNLAGFGIHFRRNLVALALGNVPLSLQLENPVVKRIAVPFPDYDDGAHL